MAGLQGGPRSNDGATADLGAPHHAPEPAGVVDGEVLAAAVVPEGDGARLPAEAAGELWPVPVLQEIVEERPTLRLGYALEALGVGGVDIEQLAACLGVRRHHRVDAYCFAPSVV